MEAFAYLIKVNIAIILLYGFYSLLLRNDTFFRWKRFVLLSIFFLSILYPLGDISKRLIENKMLTKAIENGVVFPSYYLNEVVITTQAGQASDSFSLINYLPQLLTGIYCLVATGLTVWMLIQFAGIISVLMKTNPVEIAGRKVRRKSGLDTPFSFFGYIVLDTERYSANELQEILRHEETHVRQGHSFDTIFSELMCIICWFNPFIWLMKREIRTNLEYLADRSVLDSGCDTEQYQFHLLRLTYSKAAAKITNNFNVSLLKKRIFMMNKRQTSRLGLVKYTVFLPLVAALLLFNSFDRVSGKNRLQPVEEVVGLASAETPEIVLPVMETESLSHQTQQPAQTQQPVIFSRVEIMPQFPGGEAGLKKWVQDNMKYPPIAAEKGIQGHVTLRFVVRADGMIDSVKVQKSLDPSCDEEAIRVVEKMTKWIPGKQNGKPVDVYFELPIAFKLVASNTNESVFSHVEIMPRFPGGEAALMEYLRKNVIYPKDAVDRGIQGRVTVRFIVRADGTIDSPEIQNSLYLSCDKEALRVVMNMPKWIPGKQNGEPVAVYYSLPLVFRLGKTAKK